MLKRSFIFLFILLLSIASVTPEIHGISRRPVRRGKLPRAMTPEERMEKTRIYQLHKFIKMLAPPTGNIHSPAEFNPQEGILVRWDYGWTDFEDMYCDMIDAIQDVAKVYMLYRTSAQQTYVESVLTGHGVPLTNIEWINGRTDSIWARDYGPFPIFKDDHSRAITDLLYYPGRPNDDAVPGLLGSEWGWDVYNEPFYFEGGNFISDGFGNCFISDSVYSSNPGLSTEEIEDVFREYCGCRTLHIVPALKGTIGHIDMHVKLLDVDTVLIGEVAVGNTNYSVLENVVSYFTGLTAANGNPYEILRVPMLSGFRTYTNSLLVNGVALVPTYTEPEDTTALGVYTAAGFTAVPIESSLIIPLSGATHCITHEIPPPCTSPTVPSGLAATVPGDNQIEVSWTDTGAAGYYVYRSETGCSSGMALYATVDSSPFVDSEVSGGYTYYYTVSAVDLCPSDPSACVSETATGDCLIQPVFGGVTSVTNLHSSTCTLKVQWDPAVPVCGTSIIYNIYRSEDPVFTPSVSNMVASCINSTEYVDMRGLESGQQYFYVVRAEDNSGSGRGNCGSGNEDENLVMQDGVPGGISVLGTFNENFESGVHGWSTDPAGLWHMVDSSTCTAPNLGYHSPTHAWYFGQDLSCDYDTGDVVFGSLISPVITGVTVDSQLSFYYYRYVEPPAYYVDETTVEVSSDGGRSWTYVWVKHSNNPSPDIWAHSGAISLRDFAGSNIILRFTFNSYDDWYNNYVGWLIDDVRVTNVEIMGPCATGSSLPLMDHVSFILVLMGLTFSMFLLFGRYPHEGFISSTTDTSLRR